MNDMHYKTIVGNLCYISPCAEEDAKKWATWFNDTEITILLGDEVYRPTSTTKERDSILHCIGTNYQMFEIIDKHTDEAIGRIILFDIDHVDRRAMLGIVLGEKEYWGKGYGQEAVKLILDYGFNLLNLNNIMLGTFEFNQRALSSYRKVGFKEIGRRRQARIIGSKKYDVIFMDLLADEFDPLYVQSILKKYDQ